MNGPKERWHTRLSQMPVGAGTRFRCEQCGAEVSIPTVLLDSWEKQHGIVYQREQVDTHLTRSLLLKTHQTPRNDETPSQPD